ncbi:sigma-54-dependent transcriptional regulator [Pontibacter diazotrophicus]|uniref:sigma-54-dependent transcriptional regulator n=1 Tax=Pontibacter diazotrophicus TaxID=1400979 RepID=UPI001FE2DD7B|nr:sigma-54 dependent transcriptional regulator [Pontibacter diazotrophicus]
MKTKIFVLEDDLWYSQFLSYHLSLDTTHEVRAFSSANEFLHSLSEAPDIITLDYHLPGFDGEMILSRILEASPNTYIIVISGQEDISKAVNTIKQGAYDYIVKSEETKERLWSIVEKIKQHIALKREIEALRKEVNQNLSIGNEIVGSSEPIQKVLKLIQKAASDDINLMITGETGTGKEFTARAIHRRSSRAKKPFVAVNISAIPSELLESELYGHEKGAFTGATNLHIGKFEEAHGGTLFLDEIGEMDIHLQCKLLRILQERKVTRIGANTSFTVDVRVVAATNLNLLDEVRKGNFREDLYYRLLGLQIHLPPLRERGHDLLLIAQKVLQTYCQQRDIPAKSLTANAQKKLLKHNFPGNIRELKAVVELAAVLSDTAYITPEDIQLNESQPAPFSEEKTLDEYIADTVQKYLDKYNYNVLCVADKLKIGKSTIYRMIRKKEVYMASRK